ncbi:MAG: DUF6427 family protein [Vicingaceae bacterium]|nr:DUF6427 family protein [Vicingaceae bacterium]
MLIGLFKSNQQLMNIVAILLISLVWISVFFFGDYVASDYSLGYIWLDMVVAIGLISFQLFFVSYIVNEYKLLDSNTYLPSLILVTLNCASIFNLCFHQIIVANSLIIVAFYQLLKLYNVSNKYGLLFNSGILVGLASMLYFPSVLYFVVIWLVLIYMTTPVWRDFAISLIGFVIPLIYYIAYFFVFKDLSELVFLTENTKIFEFNFWTLNIWNKGVLLMLVLLMLISAFKLLISAGKSIAKVRKMLVSVLLYFLVSILSLFLNQGDVVATLLLMSVPLSIMIGFFFQNIRKAWLAEAIYFVLVATIVFGYFS